MFSVQKFVGFDNKMNKQFKQLLVTDKEKLAEVFVLGRKDKDKLHIMKSVL